MKAFIFTFIASCMVTFAQAQAGSFSYTNGATNTVPGQPNQPAELYNGVQSGEPNQINTNTVIVPNSSFITTPTTNINNQPTVNPTFDSPVPANSTNSLQVAPSYTPKNNYNRLALFQDPVKTPKHPNQATHVGTVDGSSGKFKNPYVDHHSKNAFAKNSHHIKTAKHHKEHGSKQYEGVSSK